MMFVKLLTLAVLGLTLIVILQEVAAGSISAAIVEDNKLEIDLEISFKISIENVTTEKAKLKNVIEKTNQEAQNAHIVLQDLSFDSPSVQLEEVLTSVMIKLYSQQNDTKINFKNYFKNIQTRNDEIMKLNKENEAKEDTIKNLEEENGFITKKLNDYQNKIQELGNNTVKLTIQLKEEEKAKIYLINDLQHEKDKLAELKLQLQKESQKLKVLDEEFKKVNVSNEQLTLENQKLSDQLKTADQAKNTMQINLQDEKNEVIELNTQLTQENQKLTRNLTELNKEYEKVKVSNVQITLEKQELSDQLKTSDQAKNTMQINLQDEKNKVIELNTQLRQENRKFTDLNEECEKVKESNERLTLENRNLRRRKNQSQTSKPKNFNFEATDCLHGCKDYCSHWCRQSYSPYGYYGGNYQNYPNYYNY